MSCVAQMQDSAVEVDRKTVRIYVTFATHGTGGAGSGGQRSPDRLVFFVGSALQHPKPTNAGFRRRVAGDAAAGRVHDEGAGVGGLGTEAFFALAARRCEGQPSALTNRPGLDERFAAVSRPRAGHGVDRSTTQRGWISYLSTALQGASQFASRGGQSVASRVTARAMHLGASNPRHVRSLTASNMATMFSGGTSARTL